MIFLLAFLVIILIIMIMNNHYKKKATSKNMTQGKLKSGPLIILKNGKELITAIMDDLIALLYLTVLENFEYDDISKLPTNEPLKFAYGEILTKNIDNYINESAKLSGTKLNNEDKESLGKNTSNIVILGTTNLNLIKDNLLTGNKTHWSKLSQIDKQSQIQNSIINFKNTFKDDDKKVMFENTLELVKITYKKTIEQTDSLYKKHTHENDSIKADKEKADIVKTVKALIE